MARLGFPRNMFFCFCLFLWGARRGILESHSWLLAFPAVPTWNSQDVLWGLQVVLVCSKYLKVSGGFSSYI